MKHPQLPLRRHKSLNIILVLIFLTLIQLAHAIDTLFSQTIPFNVILGQTYGNLYSMNGDGIQAGYQILPKQSIAQFFYSIDPSKKAGLLLTISFTSAVWISDSTSDVTTICALGINKTPFLKYTGGAYQSQSSIIDKKNYLNRGSVCQYLLSYEKISAYAENVFFSALQNQIIFAIINTDTYNSLNYMIKITDFATDSFDCINDCSGNGQCDISTGECWCQTAWGDTDCSKSMTPLSLSSDYVTFSQILSYTTLTYYNYAFSYIDDLTFYMYYSIYTADSIKCYFGYEVSKDFKYLPDRWSYDQAVEVSSGGVNSISKISFTKAKLKEAFSDVDTSVQSTFRIIVGCYASSALYSSISSNSQSVLTSQKSHTLRHLSASTSGKLSFKIDNNLSQSSSGSNSHSSFSFIIAASISGGVLLGLLAFVIFCTRRRKRHLIKREQDALLALSQLQRNNPQLVLAQQILERRNQLAINDLAKAENIKAEKKYFDDIEKYFPCLTLSQVKSYFKSEVPNMKEEDISKECAICCCDFSEDPLYQSVQGKATKNKIADSNNGNTNPQKQEKVILPLDGLNTPKQAANNTPQQTSSNAQSQEAPNLRLITLCNHFFHASCINDWLKKDKSCPACRQKLGQAELNSISGNVEENIIQRTKRLLRSIKRMKTNGTSSSGVFSVASRSSFSSRNSPDINKKSPITNISTQNSPPLLQTPQQQPSTAGLNRTNNRMHENSIIIRENPSLCEPQSVVQLKLQNQNGKENDICSDGGEKASMPCGTQETEAQLMTDGKFVIELNGNNNNNLDLLNLLDNNDETGSDQQKTPKKSDFFNNKDTATPKTIPSSRGSNFNIPSGSIFSTARNLTNGQSSILRLISASKNVNQPNQNIEMKDFSQHK